MKHAILLILTSLIFTTACKKKEKTEPEPEEYFSFYADGEYFYYPQEKGLGFGGTGQTLKAWGAGTAGYIIRGYSRKDPVAGGAISLYIQGGQIPDQDTIILNNINGYASFTDFKHTSNDYYTNNIEIGRLIFTKKTANKLEGIFEFTAKQQYNGSLIHITEGKFAIIPSS